MKRISTTIIILISVFNLKSQSVSSFENITLAADTFKNGSDMAGGFTSGNAFFINNYDTTYQSWDGFSISNKRDTTTPGYRNQYSSTTGNGYNSSNYAVAYYSGFSPLRIKLTGNAKGKQVGGFYITNSTYAYLAMKNGSAYNKKFGGTSGKDPDWFKLTVNGYISGHTTDSTVSFYLADFRFMDSTKNYFVKKWTWLDLKKLGNVDSLDFVLSSTDTVGGFGMNNPAYFCMDNFTTLNTFTSVNEITEAKTSTIVYPNPTRSFIKIISENKFDAIKIVDITGKEMLNRNYANVETIDLSGFPKGIYFLHLIGNNLSDVKKLLVE